MRDPAVSTVARKKEAEVAAIVKKMVIVYKNLRTYDLNNPVLQDSLNLLYRDLKQFLDVHGLLTLLVKESELFYGSAVVYSSEAKGESLAFNLYKDGIRLISFREGLPRRELMRFMIALNEARDADPYESDLVTILWEKDLSYISYRAVDIFLESEEISNLEDLANVPSPLKEIQGEQAKPECLLRELGLREKIHHPVRLHKRLSESDMKRLAREILAQDYGAILRRCSTICLELLSRDVDDETFSRVVGFLGRICDSLIREEDFLTTCNILSDLRRLYEDDSLSEQRKASITQTIEKLGEKRKLQTIDAYLEHISEHRTEEIYAYLTLLAPNAVEPLCEILAECETRRIRYLLCRAISVIAKDEPERLKPFLGDKRWFFVRNIAMILGMTGNPEAIPLLYQAVSHPEARVRREVARSIGRIGSRAGIRILKDLITDPNKMVRMAALTSMRQIASPEAREILKPMITDRSFAKLSPDEKREFLRTYGSLGGESLAFLLDIVEGSVGQFDEKTRALAVYGISMIRDPEVEKILRTLASNYDGPIRYAALEALATISP